MGLIAEMKERNTQIINKIKKSIQDKKITKSKSEENTDEFMFDSYSNLNTTNYEQPKISKAMFDRLAYAIMAKHEINSNKKGCKLGTKEIEKVSDNTTTTTYYTEFGNIIHTKSIEGSSCFPIEKNSYTGYIDYYYDDPEDIKTPLKVFANIECKNLQGSNANYEGFVIDQNGSVIKVGQDKNHKDINFPDLQLNFQNTISELENKIKDNQMEK